MLVVALAPAAVAAQPRARDPADALMEEARQAWGRDFALADKKLRQALTLREGALGGMDPRIADVLALLGRNAWNAGDYAAAEIWLRRQLAIENSARPESFEAARALGDLGATLRELCRLAEAERTADASLAMRRRVLGASDPWIGASLDNLSLILEMQGRLSEAEARTMEAMRMTGGDGPVRRQRLMCLRRMQEPGWNGQPCHPRRCVAPVS